jgi:regulatory protein
VKKSCGFSATVVGEVVRRCRELGYLNDEAFAIQRARVLAAGRLEGNRRIALDLRERGIDEELCRRAIAEVRGELDEREAAQRLVRKKIRGRPVSALDDREKARLARGLMRKGFPTSLILSILKKTEEEWSHDDDGE